MLAWNEYVQIIIALIVIIDPLGAIPIFISLTANQTDAQRKRTAYVASFSVAIILVVSCFIGEYILKLFGISIASFRVGGGILLMLMSIAMMNARDQPGEADRIRGGGGAREGEHRRRAARDPAARGARRDQPRDHLLGEDHRRRQYGVSCPELRHRRRPHVGRAEAVRRASRRSSATRASTSRRRIMGLILAAIAVEFIASGYKVLFR